MVSVSTTRADPASRFRLLHQLLSAFSARIDLDDLIPLVMEQCRHVFGAESVAILLLDAAAGELYFPYAAGATPELAAQLSRTRFPADRGIAATVLRSGRALRVDDAQADTRFYPEVDRVTGLTTRALLSAPLPSSHGTVGVIQIVNRQCGGPFTDDDLSLLEALAESIGIAIGNAQLYGRAKESEAQLRAQVGALRRDLSRHDRFAEIIGSSATIAEVRRLMDSAAACSISVLLEGETGTGKELVARGIHRASARADAAFVPVNCAALPEALLESQLFGHRRGAFTGATQDHRGLFEAASGGTILLDEVGDMPAAMQAKLLRVLQEGEIVAVGDTRPRAVDVRVISATNRDIKAAVAGGAFRHDLYYRLAVFPIALPALRERREDIPLLVDHILASGATRHGKRIRGVEPAALRCLESFDWPGNVRELQNELERAMALAHDGEAIALPHLSAKVGGLTAPAALGTAPLSRPGPRAMDSACPGGETARGAAASASRSLRQARALFESRFIADALREHGGNVSRAAGALGLSRVMLQKKMKDYGLR
jgi:Nif-specific regulatory protein